MNRFSSIIIATTVGLNACEGFAYQVSFACAGASSNAVVFINTWSNVQARADQLDPEIGSWQPDPNDPDQNDNSCSTAQWKTIISHFSCTNSAATGFARSNVSRNTNVVDQTAFPGISNLLANAFASAASYGYSLGQVGFYDDAVTNLSNGVFTYYNWDTTEVQYMRDWLDANGYTHVLINYDARNNGAPVRSWCANPLVTSILLEANPDKWFADTGSRQELLQWLVSNSTTAGKQIVFQIPLASNYYGPTNNFMSVRWLIAWLGNTLMGYDFLRKSNVVLKAVNYNPQLQFFPEMTPDGTHYTNTMTSLPLSLIEQRAFFEGRTGVLPTQAAAYSAVRSANPTISGLANQTTTVGVATPALPFALSDPAVAPASLVVTATSSSPSLVPITNIVIRTWASTDLGSVEIASSNTLGDVITMNASGSDISGTTDAGSFIFQPLSGDGSMVARVTSLQPVNAGAKAGVMMRGSTNAASPNCFMQVAASNGVVFSWRTSSGGSTSSNLVSGILAPCWLMLVKAGTNFAGYYALDNGGSPGTWVQVGSTVGISAMNTNLLSGLAGTSHNNGVLCTAVYDNVSGNSNRNVTLTPVANQSGIATINLSVSDGWFTAANTFNLVVPTTGSDTPPAISNLTNSVSIIENGTATIPFTVGDAQSAPSSLLATGFSSNPNLIPNANLGFGGSNSNRTLTLTPVPDQTGTATISVVVNDGTLSTTNTVALTVLSYKPPVIGNLPASVTMMENSTNTVSFTVSDAQVAVSSLTVSGFSSNPALVANANLGFGGSGSNLTVTLIPSFYQIGSNTISLVVSDGVLNATNSFLLTVAPPTNYFTAVASGDINDPATWGGKVAVKGDTNVWQTGGYQIDMTLTNVDTFYGKTFVLQTGGKFFPNIANAVLTLNNLVLAGGIIICGNNGGLNLDLSGQTLTLDSGTVQSGGGTVGGRDVILGDGSLAGSGTIDITGSAGNGFYVQFQSSINPTNFTGVFSVNDNGTLYLPAIALTNASFGLNLTYPGQYQNLANVALASLVINGANLPPGSYAYTNFTASEQSFLVKSNGTITVVTVIPTVPVLAPIDDVQTLIAGQTLSLTNVATDLDYPPPTLTFSLLGSPDGLNGVPAGMVINPTNGILTWRPTIAQSLLDTMTVGVQVSNNGNPPLLAQQYFDISVVTPVNPSLTNVSLSSRRISFTITGDSGPDYVLLVSSNLTTWLPVWTNSAAMPPLPYSDAITNATRRFYQVLLGP